MTKDLCRETYAERSVGDRREAPGAHAESQQMSTGRTRVRGVTKLKEALWATRSDDSDEWASRSAQDDRAGRDD